VPEMRSSLGMPMDNSLLETSSAASGQSRCREPLVLHAFAMFSQQEPKFCALAPELGVSFRSKDGNFDCPAKPTTLP
jgi:hypothetical protein